MSKKKLPLVWSVVIIDILWLVHSSLSSPAIRHQLDASYIRSQYRLHLPACHRSSKADVVWVCRLRMTYIGSHNRSKYPLKKIVSLKWNTVNRISLPKKYSLLYFDQFSLRRAVRTHLAHGFITVRESWGTVQIFPGTYEFLCSYCPLPTVSPMIEQRLW